MREWPQFRALPQRRARPQPSAREGSPLPRISELIMEHVEGTAAEKLAWLRRQVAAGELDGDDPDEIAEADALLAMLVRMAKGREGRQRRHVDELLDEGLKGTFPASDPVTVGHFTATELPGRPVDRTAPAVKRQRKARAHGAAALRRFG
jgi:hypothetical protein